MDIRAAIPLLALKVAARNCLMSAITAASHIAVLIIAECRRLPDKKRLRGNITERIQFLS